MSNLSKSKIIAFRQCPKRLWLEIHKPELRDDSASEAVFAVGNQVGEIARRIYDPENTGCTIDIAALGHEAALALSAARLASPDFPVFEAGLTIPGALAYADVMLPARSGGAPAWDMIEVKSSTSVKDYQRDDLAVQFHIAARAGIPVRSASIAHIDSSFVYQGEGNYQGLLRETDLTGEVSSRHEEVAGWIEGARATARLPEEPEIETGPQCSSPFPCPFWEYCTRDRETPEYPLDFLPKLGATKRREIEERGITDLREVPDRFLTPIQQRVKHAGTTGETYFDAAGAAADLAPYGFPAYFLDFETTNLAVPIWKGTSPFKQIPFQFSLHVLDESGGLAHREFLDLSGDDPSGKCARALVELCGNSGPVYAYNAVFEKSVMRSLAARFPGYAAGLEAIVSRVVDLLPVARKRFYHPSQGKSWSLKAVLPAAVPGLSYEDLEGVQNGGMAVTAYTEAIHPETTPGRKEEIRRQLSDYCHLDTLATVKLWEFFSGK